MGPSVLSSSENGARHARNRAERRLVEQFVAQSLTIVLRLPRSTRRRSSARAPRLAGAVVAHHQGAHAAPTKSNDQHCLCDASIGARLSQGSLTSTTPTDHEARFAPAKQTLAIHQEALPSQEDLYSQPWACDLTACRQYSFVNCSSTWTLNHSPPPEAMPVGAQSGSAHRLRTRASIFW